jgi:Tfp pilus assembly protein PilN
MIKINLLGVAPPPTPAAAAGAPATRQFQIGVFVGALVVCFAAVGFTYKLWSSAVDKEQSDVNKEKRRQADLQGIKAQNDRYHAQVADLEQRINTIEALRASRVGPVEEMTALGDVVSRTTDVYLFTMGPQGERVVLNGQSGSVSSMANFLSSLQKSGYFEDVQLRRFFQDNQKEQLAYKFVLDMVYKSPTAASLAGQTAAPSGAAAPAKRAGL